MTRMNMIKNPAIIAILVTIKVFQFHLADITVGSYLTKKTNLLQYKTPKKSLKIKSTHQINQCQINKHTSSDSEYPNAYFRVSRNRHPNIESN